MDRRPVAITGITLLLLAAAGLSVNRCRAAELPAVTFAPGFSAEDFVAGIDNPWLPLRPGAQWTYAAGDASIHVEVLAQRRLVAGVACTVVRDTETEDGEIVEATYDWFAQDRAGNVWYMGEETAEYEDGQLVSRHGSWEAGVDGAAAGIIMPANPQPGQVYRQEYYPGQAEDMGEVLALDGVAEVPLGSYAGCVCIRDYSPLEPAANERKYFARGIGLVLAENFDGSAREELSAFEGPASAVQGILPGGCYTQEEINRQVVLAYYDLSFNQGRPEEACALYQGDSYIQHNPAAPDGAEAFIGFVNWFRGEHPQLHMEFVRTVAEGELVVVHSHQTLFPGDTGSAVMDIFRLADGRIVEHWDVVQTVPADAANDNTMF